MAKPPFITRLILKNFRSVRHASLSLGPVTFLVGRNGAGKSNLVDAFRFISDAVSGPLSGALDVRGGIQAVRYVGGRANMGLAVEFTIKRGGSLGKGRYAFEIKAEKDHQYSLSREQCRLRVGKELTWFERKGSHFETNLRGPKEMLPAKLEPQGLVLPFVAMVSEFAPIWHALALMRTYAIDPSKIRGLQDPEVGARFKSDGSNAAVVLSRIRKEGANGGDFRRICEFLGRITPGTEDIDVERHGKMLSLKFTQRWADRKKVSFEAFNVSDGTLRAVGILAAIFQRPSPTLLAIEEPEASIHPGALGAILDAIEFASARSQVVLSTHSPEVLDAKWITPEQIRVVTWEDGATRVGTPGEAAVNTMKEHLMGAGELMRAEALEVDPLFDETDPNQMPLFDEETMR